MMRILVPIDGSVDTERALTYMIERHRGGDVVASLVYVHEPPVRSHAVSLRQHQDFLGAFRSLRARDVLAAAATRLREEGIRVETSEVEGPLHRTILNEASRLDAKQIVLGVRTPLLGFRGLDRMKGLRRVGGEFPTYVMAGS